MEPGGLMPHSQVSSNNPYPEPNQPNIYIYIYIHTHTHTHTVWNMAHGSGVITGLAKEAINRVPRSSKRNVITF